MCEATARAAEAEAGDVLYLGVVVLCQGRSILLREQVGLLQRTDLEELLV